MAAIDPFNPPATVTMSWHNYTVLLGLAAHCAGDEETREMLTRITAEVDDNNS